MEQERDMIKLKTAITRKIAGTAISKYLKQNTDLRDAKVVLNDFEATTCGTSKLRVHLDVDAEVSIADIQDILRKIDLY